MLNRASDLSGDERADFEEYVEDVRQRTLDRVEAMLAEPEPALAQRVYDLAFSPSDALPRRERRPDLHSAVLADAAADAHGLAERERQLLLEFTLAIQEYYDLLDDVVDGDVAEGHAGEVQVVAQALLPMATARLGELGSEAVAYWSARALELVSAPHVEARSEPGVEAYRDLLDRQSVLFGFVPGVTAVAAGSDEAGVERAEALGRAVYLHGQLARDVEQHRAGDDDPWNAAALEGERAVLDRLTELRREVSELADDYPEPASTRLSALVALDVDGWLDGLDS